MAFSLNTRTYSHTHSLTRIHTHIEIHQTHSMHMLPKTSMAKFMFLKLWTIRNKSVDFHTHSSFNQFSPFIFGYTFYTVHCLDFRCWNSPLCFVSGRFHLRHKSNSRTPNQLNQKTRAQLNASRRILKQTNCDCRFNIQKFNISHVSN